MSGTLTTSERIPAPTKQLSWLILLTPGLAGTCALIDEILWIRLAGQVLGHSHLALALVLASFFAGLTVGALLAGRRRGGEARGSARLAGSCEILAGLVALLSPWCYAALQAGLGWLPDALLASLVVALLLLPTMAMGAFLPLLLDAVLAWPSRRPGLRAGLLIALNTGGAALGAWLAGVLLLPGIGITASATAAGLLHIGIGLGLRRLRPPDTPTAAREQQAPVQTITLLPHWLLLLAALGSGLVLIGVQLLWSRFLHLVLYHGVLTYTYTLTAVLAGLGIGGLLAVGLARWRDTIRPLLVLSLLLQAACLLFLWSEEPATWRDRTSTPLGLMIAIGLPATLHGLFFPLILAAADPDRQHCSRLTAWMQAASSLGGILAALLGSLWLLSGPGWGTSVQVLLLVALGLALVLAWPRGTQGTWATWSQRLGSISLAGLLMLTLSDPGWQTRVVGYLSQPEPPSHIVEGRQSFLSVIERRGNRHLFIDRLWQGSDQATQQRMAAHLPALQIPSIEEADVAVIGVGVGQTCAAFLHHPVATLTAVDIEPELPGLLHDHFSGAWLDDPRCRLVTADGRRFLAASDRRFAIISLELGQSWRPGIAAFYSVDCYRDVAGLLTAEGVCSQFVPINMLGSDEFRCIIASFLTVFPQAQLWYNRSELLLIGGKELQLDPGRLTRSLRVPRVADDLSYAHWGGVRLQQRRFPALGAGLLCDTRGLQAMTRDVAPYRDDRPWLAYRPARAGQPDNTAIVDLIEQQLVDSSRVWPDLPQAQLDELSDLRRAHLVDLRCEGLRWQATASEAERPEEALAAYTEISGQLPADITTQLAIARIGKELGRPELAWRSYQMVLLADPGHALAHNNLGHLAQAQGDLPTAFAHFTQAHQRDPDDPDTNVNLGNAWYARGDAERAIDHYRQALRQVPDHEYALYGLCNALIRQGEWEVAQPALRALLDRDQLSLPVMLQLISLSAGRDPRLARSLIDRALRLDPSPELQGRLEAMASELSAEQP